MDETITVREFKMWLEGFSEGITTAPTAEQWARIKEQVARINDSETPGYTAR